MPLDCKSCHTRAWQFTIFCVTIELSNSVNVVTRARDNLPYSAIFCVTIELSNYISKCIHGKHAWLPHAHDIYYARVTWFHARVMYVSRGFVDTDHKQRVNNVTRAWHTSHARDDHAGLPMHDALIKVIANFPLWGPPTQRLREDNRAMARLGLLSDLQSELVGMSRKTSCLYYYIIHCYL